MTKKFYKQINFINKQIYMRNKFFMTNNFLNKQIKFFQTNKQNFIIENAGPLVLALMIFLTVALIILYRRKLASRQHFSEQKRRQEMVESGWTPHNHHHYFSAVHSHLFVFLLCLKFGGLPKVPNFLRLVIIKQFADNHQIGGKLTFFFFI